MLVTAMSDEQRVVCLSYFPYPDTTGVYFERAFSREHKVCWLGPPHRHSSGFANDFDVSDLTDLGVSSPDLFLLIEPIGRFFPRGLDRVQCPTAVYLIDVHRDLDSRIAYVPFFDYVFVAQKDYVEIIKRRSGRDNVFWLPLGCDSELHGPKRVDKVWDVGFVGYLNSRVRARRLALLEKHFAVSDYRRSYKKEEISEVYSRSRIVFNSSIGGDLNMRVFEGMASGSLVVTDKIANGQEVLFRDRVHIVEYSNDEELLQVVRYYLAHDGEREQIARLGMELALSDHTYYSRSRFVLKTISATSSAASSSQVRFGSSKQVDLLYIQICTKFGHVDELLEQLGHSWNRGQGYFKILCFVLLAFMKRLYWALQTRR